MKIYTKTGDAGETSLFGGKRVPKDDKRITAYGTVDELNAVLGIVAAQSKDESLREIIFDLQNKLFDAGADLAAPFDGKNIRNVLRLDGNYSLDLEKTIDLIEEKLEPLKNFILPGGSGSAAFLHFARTICRRAEREIISLGNYEKINPELVIFFNRFSDLLFVLARYANKAAGVEDIAWKKSK